MQARILDRFYHCDALGKNHRLQDAVLARHCCLRMTQERRKLFVRESRSAKRISRSMSKRMKIQLAPNLYADILQVIPKELGRLAREVTARIRFDIKQLFST